MQPIPESYCGIDVRNSTTEISVLSLVLMQTSL